MLKILKKNILLSSSSAYLIANIVSALAPLALIPILTQYLTPKEYGEASIFQTLISAFLAFIGLSTHLSASRKYYENSSHNEIGRFNFSCLLVVTSTTLIAIFLLLTLQSKLSDSTGLSAQWLLISILVAASTAFIQLRLSLWQVQKKALSYGALQISQSLANLILSLLLVVVLSQGVDGRMSAHSITIFIASAIALLLLKRDGILIPHKPNLHHIKDILAFGIPLIPHVGGIFLLTSADRLIISSRLGLAEAGIYMLAVQISSVVGLIFDAANKAYMPWLYEKLSKNTISEKIKIVRINYTCYLVILSGAGIACFLAPWIINNLINKTYAQAGAVIGWLIIGQAFSGMYLLVANHIFYSKNTKVLSVVTISTGILHLTLLVLLINKLGVEGAAIAFCISMAIRFILTWTTAQIVHPMPWLKTPKNTTK
ncbi:lipopolysaccharide biosynthesis protein [Pseudomonas sp. OF001]|uniref:lipopolysaccharide biosynthesis protein n=1 Tax=Pseudomonas sp. OF001 TaxID=2772300 RepID=UPI001919B176|nr:oligosaccharide flippase family protein [Pseudomonas sp. OF001]